MKQGLIWLFVGIGCQDAKEDLNYSDESNEGEESIEEEGSDTDDPDTDDEVVDEEEEIEIPACPENVICAESFPFQHTGDTSLSSKRDFDNYSCAPSTDESGAEVVYRFILPHDGFLSLELYDMESGADVDIHLLGSLNSADCIDRGHWLAGSYLPAGEYWVVADSWVNASGSEKPGVYSLQVGLTTEEDFIASGMEEEVAGDALHAFDIAWSNDELDSFVYSVTDFSLHSSEKRMWIYDLASNSLLHNLHVAHGEGSSDPSDEGYASTFSNTPDSLQSSLGMMRAAESYTGSFGYSMRIDGLESYNDKVRERFIVFHGWEGSRPEYVNQFGMVAPTWGCPAVDDREVTDLVDILTDGSGMLFWYP
ncbi:MAG: murein L,D-transpeptidase catalytic domain family protein, partial [Myxococcota bacterium]|nr:murein L,D-transpeptidase catalytic domain family protein [Myxococcota bacterium]